MQRTNSQTIHIFLPDGSPHGIRIANIGNRVAKAIALPRNRIKEGASRPELNRAGLYFLIGEDPDVTVLNVYIGEAENVYKRLTDHVSENVKDYWQTAVAFISTDESLTKAHVKYLESYCYQQAKANGRCSLKNGNVPTKSSLPESVESETLEFYDNLNLLLSTLGYPILDESPDKTETVSGIYTCKNQAIEAHGKLTDEGFVVLAGSTASRNTKGSLGDSINGTHERLLELGIISEKDDEAYIFQKDYLFRSPSGASDFVLGYSSNGWVAWKGANGATLHDRERALVKE